MTLNICVDLIWEEKSLMMGSRAKSWSQDLSRGSLCSAPSLREIFPKITQTIPLSLCCKAFLFCLSSLQTIMEPAILQFSTNPSSFASLLLTIIIHFPSWKISPVNLLSTSAFQSGHFSVPEDNPAALISCAVWQSILQPAASSPVLSGYDHCHQHLGAKPFLASAEHIQNVTVKSQKWTLWLQEMLHLGFKS